MNRAELVKLLGPSLLEKMEARGLRVVPVNPTDEMLDAASQTEDNPDQCGCTAAQRLFCNAVCRDVFQAVYRNTIAASPFAPETG